MKAKYEITFSIDGENVVKKEFSVQDSDKEIIAAAVWAAIVTCNKICCDEIKQALESS